MSRLGFSLPLATHHLVKPLIVSGLLVILHVLFSVNDNVLVLDFAAVIDGEWWRILSGNFVHSSDMHLAFNLLGVWLVWLLFAESYDRTWYVTVIIVASLSVGIGESVLSNYSQYVGLSGTLHGLLIFGAGVEYLREKRTDTLLIAGIIVVKIIAENTTGMSMLAGQAIGGNVAVTSHLFGFLGGLAVFLVYFATNAQKPIR